MLTIKSSSLITSIGGLRVSTPSVEQSLSYRTGRMPLCFAQGIQAAAQALVGTAREEVGACYFFTYWGAASLARDFYEHIEHPASGQPLPLMFQNTTNAVALGQLAIELGLRCPMYTLSAPPSRIVRTALQLSHARRCCHETEEGRVTMIVASDEAPPWLQEAVRLSDSALEDHQFGAIAAAILLRSGASRGEWHISRVEETRHLAITGDALDLVASSCERTAVIPDVYVLGESESNVRRALSDAQIRVGHILHLGMVEASAANALTSLVMACNTPPLKIPAKRLICARGLDGGFCWILIET